MRPSLLCLGILLILLLSACNRASVMQVIVPAEDEKVAQYYINLLREGQFDPIERDMDPSPKDPGLHGEFGKMLTLIPQQEPTSLKVVGWNTYHNHTFSGDDTSQTNITYEYEFPTKWLLINVATQKKGNVFTIIGFRVTPISDSLENLNKFTLHGKSLIQYAVLIWGCVTTLVILCTLVLCIRIKIERRKWLWILFILFGIGELSMDWTTGQWSISPLSFQLFGFSGFASGYGPWVIKVSFPLGALVFLLRGKKPASQESQAPRNDS